MARIVEVLMRAVNGLAIALALLLVNGGGAAVAASAEELPNRPIVDGHRIQPRATEFNGTNSNMPRDVSSEDAKEIDRLYRQLLRDSAPPTREVR